MKLIKIVINPVIRNAISRTLVGRIKCSEIVENERFTKSDVKVLLKRTWYNFDNLSTDLPKEPTLGSRISILLACITLSFYKALVEYGVTKKHSIQLVRDVSWLIYRKFGYIPLIISKLISRNKLKRIKICTSLFRKFPFNPPGYDMKDVNCVNEVAYDVLKCPVANYFMKIGELEFCSGTWCDLDYSLAQLWGGCLERTSTIANGDDRCDFRFKTNQ